MATYPTLPAAIRTQALRAPGTEIYYPEVAGLSNPAAEHAINRAIRQAVQALARRQQEVQTGTNPQTLGSYEIKTNERGILSLTLSNYTYSQGMAHGMTYLKSLTFDTSTGRAYELSDLFKPGSGYAAALSQQVAGQIQQRGIQTLQPFTSIRPDQDYYLADKALVIYFQLYEITPYYVGFPMFPISVYSVQPMVAEGGPLDRLSADIG
ncbi:DUF3298 and DUF4163 domain-containing protein [Paenibacillus thermoaerophilus]|uniref:DUF3298 and DUF4163 domain-containing protein n=1 Tax=Paenibacillus thermoaerophilus TaxID=1215385 RepID=A0ABW2UZS6_9BACL|nr:DUF3298 and DUF4163 domain-containing protein [Paenibacillus thermoaerophilus]TMV08238.1 DUF3298 and DUF4163 domain-containing protein [Paenibacillus thermoaerophilus]